MKAYQPRLAMKQRILKHICCGSILQLVQFDIKHFMTGPKGNSEFCFPRSSMFPSTSTKHRNKGKKHIDQCTVVCLVTWPVNTSEAGGDLALIQTSVPFSSTCQLLTLEQLDFTTEAMRSYQNKVTCSLAAIQRPGR